MSAQPLRKPDHDEPEVWRKAGDAQDNRIYVIPPWAVRTEPSKKRRMASRFGEWLDNNRALQGFKVEVIAVGLAVLLLGLGYIGLKGAYRLKSQEGVQLVNEAHAPNLLPFLR